MNIKLKIVLSSIGSVLFAIPFYIIVHEGGHALVALSCGAKITAFSVFGAYMSYEGASFSTFAFSLFNAAGMLFPVFISIVYMLLYSSRSSCILYKIFSFVFFLLPTASILAWVFLPILYLFKNAPANEDVTNFISNSGLNPITVTAAAAVLFAINVLIAWKKKIIQNYYLTLKSAWRKTSTKKQNQI